MWNRKVEIQILRSESGLSAAGPAGVKHSKEGIKGSESAEGRAPRGRACVMIWSGATGNVVWRCCWDESEFETELFIGIAQLALHKTTW
jgi:hypothetical protein